MSWGTHFLHLLKYIILLHSNAEGTQRISQKILWVPYTNKIIKNIHVQSSINRTFEKSVSCTSKLYLVWKFTEQNNYLIPLRLMLILGFALPEIYVINLYKKVYIYILFTYLWNHHTICAIFRMYHLSTYEIVIRLHYYLQLCNVELISSGTNENVSTLVNPILPINQTLTGGKA